MVHSRYSQLAVVVLPTYNEAGNVEELIRRLLEATKDSEWRVEILVVDDCSPDGTGNIVSSLMPHDRVHLITNKEKRGIGFAYKLGYQYALHTLKADAVIEMDADLQHLPEQVPELIYEIDQGYDFVIGSRKIAGSDNSIVNRGIWRYFLTVFGGWLVRFILCWPGRYFDLITDPTSGFRATRRSFALKINFDAMVSWSFPYKYDTLYQLMKMGASIREIPLRFQGRVYGKSKMEGSAVRQALFSAIKIRFG